jgi:hypothetical protein
MDAGDMERPHPPLLHHPPSQYIVCIRRCPLDCLGWHGRRARMVSGGMERHSLSLCQRRPSEYVCLHTPRLAHGRCAGMVAGVTESAHIRLRHPATVSVRLSAYAAVPRMVVSRRLCFRSSLSIIERLQLFYDTAGLREYGLPTIRLSPDMDALRRLCFRSRPRVVERVGFYNPVALREYGLPHTPRLGRTVLSLSSHRAPASI